MVGLPRRLAVGSRPRGAHEPQPGAAAMPSRSHEERWPALSYAEWAQTYRTLHLWTQIVGKVRLSQTPWLNHSWQTPLYVTPRGLTTGAIFVGERVLDLEFDFIDQA